MQYSGNTAFLGNPLLDVYACCDAGDIQALGLTPGSTHHVEEDLIQRLFRVARIHKIIPGGGGYTAASVFADVGGGAVFIGSVGKDFFPGSLNHHRNIPGLKNHLIAQSGFTGSCWYIDHPESDTGNQTVIVHPGASGSLDVSQLDPVLSGLSMGHIFLEGFVLPRFFDWIGSYCIKTQVKMSFDLGSVFVVRKYFPRIFDAMKTLGYKGCQGIIFGTQVEFEELFSRTWLEGLQELKNQGWEGVVKFGPEGAASLGENGEVLFYRPQQVLPGNPRGAGDVFAGAYLYSRVNGGSVNESLTNGGEQVVRYFCGRNGPTGIPG